MSILRNTLKQDAFWKLNKVFVYQLGIEESVILTVMLDKFYYYHDNKQTVFTTDEDGTKEWFFYTSEAIKTMFKIGYKVQKRILENLQEAGFIEQKAFGVPCKLHFHLHEDQIFHLLNTSISEMENPVLPKGQNWNCQKDETIIKNIDKEQNDKQNTVGETPTLFGDLNHNIKEEERTAREKTFKERCTAFVDKFNELRGTKYQATNQVQVALRNRLKIYKAEQIMKALNSCVNDPYHIENDYKYVTPEYILREKTLERYLNTSFKAESNTIVLQ